MEAILDYVQEKYIIRGALSLIAYFKHYSSLVCSGCCGRNRTFPLVSNK